MLGADDKDYTDLQAQFSLAYISAVAAVGGFFAEELGRGSDKDGVDMTILRRGPYGTARSPRLDVQLKSEGGPAPTEDPFRYVLKAKNWNDLCDRTPKFLNPRILVVVLVPKDAGEWLGHTEAALAMRHCGYWYSLANQPALPDGAVNRTLRIPRSNVLTPQSLTDMMMRISTNQPV